jgi:hypothetical protein
MKQIIMVGVPLSALLHGTASAANYQRSIPSVPGQQNGNDGTRG